MFALNRKRISPIAFTSGRIRKKSHKTEELVFTIRRTNRGEMSIDQDVFEDGPIGPISEQESQDLVRTHTTFIEAFFNFEYAVGLSSFKFCKSGDILSTWFHKVRQF